MDSSAVNANVTVDDFDSIIAYPDQSVWFTPDPSANNYSATGSEWLLGTYHKTNTTGAELSLNFTGPAIYIYGHSGPEYGSYQVEIDGQTTNKTAYAASNASTPYILYSSNNMTYARHSLTLRNLGAQSGDKGGNAFLFDFLLTTVQLAPAGASVKNTTIEEDSKLLTYDGVWGNNTSPIFSGGGSAYTNGDKASVSLKFNGSAIYVLGDKKNDHGLYNIYLDNGTAETFNGISGCGGAFGQTCEQQRPTLAYFASNLPEGEHTIKIENVAGVNQSYFDLDSIVVTVPTKYAPRDLGNSSGATSTQTSSPGQTSNAATPLSPPSLTLGPLLMLFLSMMWLIKTLRK